MTLTSLGKVHRIQRLVEARQEEKSSSDNKLKSHADRLIADSLLKEAKYGLRSMFIGVLIMFIGCGFFWLAANSWHITETQWIGGLQGLINALTVQEVCLCIELYFMMQDASEQFRKAQSMKQVATFLLENTASFSQENISLSAMEMLSDWKPFWDAGISIFTTYDPQRERKLMEKERQKVQEILNNIVGESPAENEKKDKRRELQKEEAQDLLAMARVTELEGYREWLYFCINAIAFYGYALGILVFYFQDEESQPAILQRVKLGMNNTDADWYGNFAGDFMWTVEPCFILTTPLLLNALKPKKQKKKIKSD